VQCHDSCRKCYGVLQTECEACYEPYYLEHSTCVYNETLANLYPDRFGKKLPDEILALYIFLGVVALIGLLYLIKGWKKAKIWLIKREK